MNELKTTCIKRPSTFRDHCSDTITLLNSLPDDKFLDWSKLEALAEDKMNLTYKQKFFWNG